MSAEALPIPTIGTHNTALDARTSELHATPLHVDGYVTAGFLGPDDAATLRSYVAPAKPSPELAAALLKLLTQLKGDGAAGALVLLDDILSCASPLSRQRHVSFPSNPPIHPSTHALP